MRKTYTGHVLCLRRRCSECLCYEAAGQVGDVAAGQGRKGLCVGGEGVPGWLRVQLSLHSIPGGDRSRGAAGRAPGKEKVEGGEG